MHLISITYLISIFVVTLHFVLNIRKQLKNNYVLSTRKQIKNNQVFCKYICAYITHKINLICFYCIRKNSKYRKQIINSTYKGFKQISENIFIKYENIFVLTIVKYMILKQDFYF